MLRRLLGLSIPQHLPVIGLCVFKYLKALWLITNEEF